MLALCRALALASPVMGAACGSRNDVWCSVDANAAGPLNAVVAAQAEAAMTTVKFINAGE
jgi:hypothetical protein